jgi:hypothetical protein
MVRVRPTEDSIDGSAEVLLLANTSTTWEFSISIHAGTRSNDMGRSETHNIEWQNKQDRKVPREIEK